MMRVIGQIARPTRRHMTAIRIAAREMRRIEEIDSHQQAMPNSLSRIRSDAGLPFVRASNPDDEVFVINFGQYNSVQSCPHV